MLIDHLLIDRAYGGRFQLKSWKEISKTGKAWDVLIDTGKDLPQTAKAGTQEEAEYQLDAIQNYIRGKMRKAEFWLGKLIEAYTRAKDIGVRDDILREVWLLHDKATSSGNGGRLKTAMASTTSNWQGNP